MLTLKEIFVVKDGGSRQMQFTDEAEGIHEFYLRKTRGYGSRLPGQRYTGLFKGNMTGRSACGEEPASREEIQQVCDALERWNRRHDTAPYRELKTRWDDACRRLEEEMNGDRFEVITAIMKELSDLETSKDWQNHVEEAVWIKQAILESTRLDSNFEYGE